MKKLFICAALAALCTSLYAEDGEPKPVVIHYDVRELHPLQGGMPRSQILCPSLFIEDHTFTFTNSCVGYTLQLLQDDEVVYTYYIDSTDDLVLPGSLIGVYEIRLVSGSFTFVGEIEL